MRIILSNRRGISYVLTCVCILVAMTLVAISMQYALVYHVAREQQRETQLKLDSYVTQYAVNKYDALKQGTPWDEYIDNGDLVNGAYIMLGFSPVGGQGSNETLIADGKYVMSRPSIYATSGDTLGIMARYKIIIPFELFNREIAEITVPVTLVSQYKLK